MATTGSCFCEAIKYAIQGNPIAAFRCHCLCCRKISGSTNATSIIVPVPAFTVTQGAPKEFTVTANSGKPATNFFCGDCGVTLYRHGEATPDVYYIKSGTLDGDSTLDEICKPTMELFVKRKVSWVPLIEGAVVKQELY